MNSNDKDHVYWKEEKTLRGTTQVYSRYGNNSGILVGHGWYGRNCLR